MNTDKSIVEYIKDPELEARGIKLFIKRDDLIDEVVSGNKWRKLKYNVELCQARKNEGILTFGGAYSNHLVATASACQKIGLKSIGIIRGDELNPDSNATLQKCSELGMKLVFVSREEYLARHEKAYHEDLSYTYPNHHIVPEGGANYYGIVGCQEIMSEVEEKIDHVFIAQGTSATSCGVLCSLKENQTLHVVPALKGYRSLEEMRNLMASSGMEASWVETQLKRVEAHPEFHFGGYGRFTEELLKYIQNFYRKHGIKLDPVYTGKVMFALTHELQNTRYSNTNVLFIHTGGIQGAAAIEQKSGFKLYN